MRPGLSRKVPIRLEWHGSIVAGWERQENCQVAVSLSVATATGSLPIAWRLYLPEEWANDPVRRAEVEVPKQVQFQTKPQIALTQIGQAVEDGVLPGVVLADEVYGSAEIAAIRINCLLNPCDSKYSS